MVRVAIGQRVTPKGYEMRLSKVRFWAAALVAFLLGFPFTDKVFAGVSDVVGSSIDLGLSIADSAGGS